MAVVMTTYVVDEHLTVRILESAQPFRVAVQQQSGIVTLEPSRYNPWLPTGEEHWFSLKEKGNIRVVLAREST